MKKCFFFAVAAMMLLATGCNLQPTEINAEDLPDQVKISGFLRYTAIDKNGKGIDPVVAPKSPVYVFYGTKVDGNMQYKRYDLTSDAQGYFSMSLGVKPGQVIDEVKVQGSLYVDMAKPGMFTPSYARNTDSGKMEMSSTEYFGEVSKTNLVCGKAYFYDVNMTPSAYTSNPDLEQPK